MFAALGKDPVEVIRTIFWDPLFGEFAFYFRGQLLVKAAPLILIAVGLSLGFKAGDLEHRGRRTIHPRRDLRRSGGLAFYPAGGALADLSANDNRGRAWRLGLGDDPGDPEDPVQHQ